MTAQTDTLADRYGGWALITGASSGIGRALAGEVAAQGMPCVILSDEREALEQTRDELIAAHGVEVDALCLDLAELGVAQRISAHLDERPLGLLISNASFGRTGPFGSDDITVYRRMLAVNVDAYVALTHQFLPGMVHRGAGASSSSPRSIRSSPASAAARSTARPRRLRPRSPVGSGRNCSRRTSTCCW